MGITISVSAQSSSSIAAVIKKKAQNYHKEYRKKNPPKKTTKEYNQRHYLRHRDKARAKVESNMDNKVYFCTLCNQPFKCNSELEKHNMPPSHLKKVEWGEEGYRCEPCGLKFRFV